MRSYVLTAISVGAVLAIVVGCQPVTWMDGPGGGLEAKISPKGPSLGTLRHRDQWYDLRSTSAVGTSKSNDPFLKDFKNNSPMARDGFRGPDARSEIDAVAVEDVVADVNRQ